MDTLGKTVLSPLESLPLELVETIAQYLAVKDVGACCGTSDRMRELFGSDVVWKSRCDKEQAEYLRITPCKVEPGFVSPEVEGSTLSPVSQWRMAFMRENHLWNNWRQGKTKTEDILDNLSYEAKKEAICYAFLSNDHIVVLFRTGFRLLDVREYPALDAVEPIHFPFSSSYCMPISAGNDMITIPNLSGVLTYQVDLEKRLCNLIHLFFFEEEEKLTVKDLDEIRGKFETLQSQSLSITCVVGNYFVGVLKGQSTMHIWDLWTGIKVKREECCVDQGTIIQIKSSDDMNLVLAVEINNQTYSTKFLAYSLTKLSYYPFRKTVHGEFKFIVIKDYFGLWTCRSARFYNYQTAQLVLNKPCNNPAQTHIQAFRNSFLFIQEGTLQSFNPATPLLAIFPATELISFNGLGNRFIQVARKSYSHEIWEVGGMSKNINKTAMRFKFDPYGFYMNKALTRYILKFDDDGAVIHFW